MSDQTSLYVDRFYVCQSEYERVVFGRYLQDGMVVLIEDPSVRVDLDHVTSPYERERLAENNRWCEVTQLHQDGDLIAFVGVYPDGTERVRKFHMSFAWIVKKDPMAGESTESDEVAPR